MSPRRLLSIDGGGIRGIIPLCVLAALEQHTGRAVHEDFPFLAGTSTGAIICAGLARGIQAEELLVRYQGLGPQVFRRDWIGWAVSLGSFRYRARPLAEAIGRITGDVVLNDLPVDILISAVRVIDGHAWYFVKDNERNAKTTGRLKLVDCVTASAAAPTFFEPWDVPTVGLCVDGGVGIAGNPVYKACVEAFHYTNTYRPSETIVVSLGTGRTDSCYAPTHFVDWALWTLGALLRAPAEQQTELVRRHFAAAAMYRIDSPLPRDIGMDDVRAIPELTALGRKFAATIDWGEILGAGGGRWRITPRASAVGD